MTPADDGKLDALCERSRCLFARSVELVCELELPLEVLDVEVLLDDEHAALQLLRWADCDVRPFVAALSREFKLHVHITDLSRPKEEEEEEHGCGREGCGSDGGGCGSCGTGGGCGSCGTEKKRWSRRRISRNFGTRWKAGESVCCSALLAGYLSINSFSRAPRERGC